MDRLSGVEELLDGPLDDPRALAGNLRDLRRVNRWLGGIDLSQRAIDRLDDGERPVRTMLDVGTGAADIPLALIARARTNGHDLQVVGLDSRPEVLAAAATMDRAVTSTDGLELQVGDGRSLPYDDDAFDLAHTSLAVHHLEPAEAVAFVREMVRVARHGVVINDLTRGRFLYLGAWLLAHVATTNRYTRHDGPLSVRRAYTPDELVSLLEQAGLEVVARIRGPFGHRWAIAARIR